MAAAEYLYHRRALPRHRPLLLRAGDVPGATPVRIFVVILAFTAPVLVWFDIPMANPLQLAYAIAIGNYLARKYEEYLDDLRPVLTLTDAQVRAERLSIRRLYGSEIAIGAVIAPVLLLIVNSGSPDLRALLSGKLPSTEFIWEVGLALLTWIFILQAYNVVFSGVFQFKRLGEHHTRIDLLDLGPLTPYSMVGISTLLIIVGAYTLVPVAYLDRAELLRPALLSLMISFPTALFFLVVPVFALHRRIKDEKRQELQLITHAINGKRKSLQHSHLGTEAPVSTIELLQYRKYIEGIDEWPIGRLGARRLVVYVLVPVSSWVASHFVELLLRDLL